MRILLTHDPESLANYYGSRALSGLRRLGEVGLNATTGPLPTEKLIEAAQGCEILVADRATPGEAALFDACPHLVAFLRCAVDVRTVDVEAASRNGILVTNASPGFIDAVAELTFGLMVDLARDVSRHAAAYRQGQREEVRMGHQLSGSTLGVLGYGGIGRRVAALGTAFGMKVLACDPYQTVGEPDVEQVEMEALLARSDFLVCLVVANEQTEKLMDAAAFEAMKPTAYFVNMSRGNLVDEEALAVALVDGKIAGAAMDVGRAPDQMPSPALAALPNVVATPHIGGLTPSAIEAQAMETVAQATALAEGRLPHNVLNLGQASRLSRLGIEPDGGAGS